MKIVLDTNVLVSDLLNPYGPPGQIVRMAAAGNLSLAFDARLLGEYGDVLLRPKFDFRAEHVEALTEQIRTGGTSASAEPLSRPLPDRDDEPFLEVAIAAAAGYLVTGNPRHYPAPLRGGVRVVTPTEFIEIIRQHGEWSTPTQ
jgi:putative PIN family toxin of toxin-antitoxin system